MVINFFQKIAVVSFLLLFGDATGFCSKVSDFVTSDDKKIPEECHEKTEIDENSISEKDILIEAVSIFYNGVSYRDLHNRLGNSKSFSEILKIYQEAHSKIKSSFETAQKMCKGIKKFMYTVENINKTMLQNLTDLIKNKTSEILLNNRQELIKTVEINYANFIKQEIDIITTQVKEMPPNQVTSHLITTLEGELSTKVHFSEYANSSDAQEFLSSLQKDIDSLDQKFNPKKHKSFDEKKNGFDDLFDF